MDTAEKKYTLTEDQIRQIFIDGSMNQYKLADPEAWSNYMLSRCGNPIASSPSFPSDSDIEEMISEYLGTGWSEIDSGYISNNYGNGLRDMRSLMANEMGKFAEWTYLSGWFFNSAEDKWFYHSDGDPDTGKTIAQLIEIYRKNRKGNN